MPAPLKATDEKILSALGRAGSLHAAAAEIGISHSTVHRRLVKLGKNTPKNIFTEQDDARLREHYDNYANAGKLAELARIMSREKSTLCGRAKTLGLTNMRRPKSETAAALISLSRKAWHRSNEHPRGMLGKRHTEKFKDEQSERSFVRWHAMSKEQQLASQSKTKRSWAAGWRVVGERRIYFRSSWEANYGRYLDWLLSNEDISAWDHEPQTFWFGGIKRGIRSYLPDFKVTEKNGSVVFHEVKGWMDAGSKTKLKRMAKYHPSVRLLLIDAKAYRAIAKTMSSILPDWEGA